MPVVRADGFRINTLVQVFLIVAIAALLNGAQRLPLGRAAAPGAPARRLAA
jgi:hypothetical protein